MAAPPPIQMASGPEKVEVVEEVDPTEKLCNALYSIDCSGSFAASCKLKDAYLAPIFVNDIGPVGFPLNESTALQLVEKARQAPFGMGSETIVDTSIRNTWELDNTQFQLAGEQWTTTIDIASKWAAKMLGVHVPSTAVTAELYKMLIYEKGALFKAHTEYATIALCITLVLGRSRLTMAREQLGKGAGNVRHPRHLPSIQTRRWRPGLETSRHNQGLQVVSGTASYVLLVF